MPATEAIDIVAIVLINCPRAKAGDYDDMQARQFRQDTQIIGYNSILKLRQECLSAKTPTTK